MSCVILKFGGAAMASIDQFAKLAKLIEKRLNKFSAVVVVVSAMGSTTDELMELAGKVHRNPPKREQDMLVSVGERVSMALLAMALDARGIDAISFTGSQSGIITSDEHSDARILEVRPERVRSAIGRGKVVIVAGFQGVSLEKEITTLGRGGSDTSAVALAVALKADKVEFYKDVPGIGKVNPKVDPDTEIFSELSFDQTLEIVEEGAEVLHHRCLEMAKEHGMKLEIRPYYDPDWLGTEICPLKSMQKI